MPRTRTTYTAEFKLAPVKMVTDQKLSVAEAARLKAERDLLKGAAAYFANPPT